MTGSAPLPPDVPPAWQDGKAPDALRTIGEVGQALGIRQHVLRYWEDQFPMLSPLKRSGGRRYYRPEDVALVRRIDQLVHREGYTLRGARSVLEGESRNDRAGRPATLPASEPSPVPAPLPARPPVIASERPPASERALRLLRMRARLIEALEGILHLRDGEWVSVRDPLRGVSWSDRRTW